MGKISDDEMNIPIIFRNVKYPQELPSLCCTDCMFAAGKFFEENLNPFGFILLSLVSQKRRPEMSVSTHWSRLGESHMLSNIKIHGGEYSKKSSSLSSIEDY